jgi:hypothetical protein
MVNVFRTVRAGRWVLIAAMAAAYASVGLGCHHDHDDDYNRAAYHDRSYDHHDYDRHDVDRHDYDRGY